MYWEHTRQDMLVHQIIGRMTFVLRGWTYPNQTSSEILKSSSRSLGCQKRQKVTLNTSQSWRLRLSAQVVHTIQTSMHGWTAHHTSLACFHYTSIFVSLLLTTRLRAHDVSVSCDVYTCLVVHVTIFRVPLTYALTPTLSYPPHTLPQYTLVLFLCLVS
jgi:hypothetical protein